MDTEVRGLEQGAAPGKLLGWQKGGRNEPNYELNWEGSVSGIILSEWCNGSMVKLMELLFVKRGTS